jgi:hypothetical protein
VVFLISRDGEMGGGEDILRIFRMSRPCVLTPCEPASHMFISMLHFCCQNPLL